MAFEIAGVKIGPAYPPYVVAELSANHGGLLERALESIAAAKANGASAVKIQTYTADTMTIDSEREDFQIRRGPWAGYRLYDLYREAETPYAWHHDMFQFARNIGITLFSTPFDESAVDLLEGLNSPAYKIASFELIDLPLLRYVARTGKPIVMSTGIATEEEIEEALDAARGAGCENLLLLHCVSSYPAPIEQTNLRRIEGLARRFGVPTGLSDHTLGTVASVAAVAAGACFIEKHFTLTREHPGPDSHFSIEPEDLRRLCEDTKSAWLAMGSLGSERQASETENVQFRRSVYFVADLPAGALVLPHHVRRIRPGYGLHPRYFEEIIGRRLKSAVTRGTACAWEHFDE